MTVLEEENLTKVKVAVRLRPFNKRELELKSKSVVTMSKDQTLLFHPLEEKEPKPFTFDHCFNSSTSAECSSYSSQEDVFQQLGSGVVESAFSGYNACIFAYGQTGSGKSYTMMGSSDNMGIIPRLCNAIFQKIDVETNESTSFKVEVSYMEIYNERVRDLLDPKNSSKRPLKVREHAVLGPMVEGLSVLAVSSYEQIARLMEDGNKCRTVAATNMNAESSRSHAVFTIRLSQTMADLADSTFTGEKVSKISLVDLAGSERAQKSGAIGKRLEEGANINKSLTTLGMVISALAERNGKKEKFVPYRDSVLTWLLKDNLGGNSKTVMIATVSPSGDNYEETLSTLRYADRAKKIVNHAVVNEDPNAKVIRELREEVENLRLQINQNQERQNEAEELRDRLAESERLVEMMNKSWEDRLKETDLLYREHQRDLAQIGICVAESGIKMEKDRFYLVNLNADPSLNELLVYYINQKAIVGSNESSGRCSSPNESDQSEKVDFLLQGLGVHPYHALLEIIQESSHAEDELPVAEHRPKLLYVSSLSQGARICVNGRQVEYGQKTVLRNGFRLLIGNNHFFRVNCPKDESYKPDAACNGFLVPTSISTSSIGGLDGELNPGFIDYDKAWLEANSDENALNDSNGGVSTSSAGNISTAMDQYIEQIAIKYQEDKQAALEKQYEEFERYIQGLAQSLQTPSTPMTPAGGGLFGGLVGTPSCQLPPISFPLNPRHADKSKFFKWAQKREDLFKQSLSRLKTEIVKANALAREANLIAEEMWVGHSKNRRGLARYDVTLQIPASNLRPSKIKAGNSVCEPVIVVKWQGMSGYQLWTVDHLENKLVDMRELYNERQLKDSCAIASTSSSGICCCLEEEEDMGEEDLLEDTKPSSLMFDSLFESQEKHSLIGVANVFLEVLFHQLRLDYQVPIISQQGEVCGKLHVEVYRLPDSIAGEPDAGESSSSNDSFESEGSSSSSDSSNNGQPKSDQCFMGSTIKCRVRIKKAMNLPTNLSHFVFCQYSFFNLTEMLVVAPNMEAMDNKKGAKLNAKIPGNSNTFKFAHQQDFTVLVTEEFLEYVQEDALSIEVWGHRSGGEDFDSLEEASALKQETKNRKSIKNGLMPALKGPQFDANGRVTNKHVSKKEALLIPRDIAAQKRKSLQERWAEVTKRIELWVEIKEMNDGGEYVNVDVLAQPCAGADRTSKNGCSTGGVYQLKQGQQRRLTVRVRGVDFENSGGTLPLSFSDILSVGIGSIVVKEGNSIITSSGCSPNPDYYTASNWSLNGEGNLWSNRTEASRPLDSYQEEDLDRIREQWSRALACRHHYLETQINELELKGANKSELEVEREQSLINQWVELTEERNAVSLPTSNSYIPGAPADWHPPTGIEYHVPVVFLDLDAEELAADEAMEDEECATFGSKIAGLNTMLPYEKFEQMILLPVLEKDSLEMSATCSWDSSIHFCHALNRPSNAGEMVFAIVNATCRLSYPFSMDLVIRKRICLNIYKKASFTDRIMRRIVGMGNITGTGVFYDVVAHIPKSSLEMEDRATLALMAVRHTTCLEDEHHNKPYSSLSSQLATESIDVKADITANQTTMGNNCWSYVEAYTKSIQAVEWMLKLDRLRQESAMLNMLSRQEQRGPRISHYGQPMSNLRMKRTISLPNTTANVALPPIPPRNLTAKTGRRSNYTSTERDLENENSANSLGTNEHRLMEVSASSSSGYSSMVNSMVSPLFDHRLTGIDEEQVTESLGKDAVIRSSTVPETLNDSNNMRLHTKTTPSQLYTPSNSESQDSINNNELSLPLDFVSNDLNSSDESSLSCTNRLFEQQNVGSHSFNHFEETEVSTPSLIYSKHTSTTHPKSFFANTISATAMLSANNNNNLPLTKTSDVSYSSNKQKDVKSSTAKLCQRSPRASTPPVCSLEEILEN